MNYKTVKLLGVLAGLTLLGGISAHAQDKATLDLLVKKGVITQAEADGVSKSAAEIPVVSSKSGMAKRINLQGLLQTQFDGISASTTVPHGANVASVDQMYLRRAQIGVIADLGNGWGSDIMADFAATQVADQAKQGLSPQGVPTTQAAPTGVQYLSQNLFERAIITKQVPDWGTAAAGYQKVNFLEEELTPSDQLLAIERSVLTRYFDEYYGSPSAYRLAFAQRHAGLFWKGTNVPGVPGLYYSAAFVNGIQNNINFTGVGGLNSFGGWFGLGYKNSYSGVGYDFGINTGYSGDGNSDNANLNSAGSTAHTNQRNATWGYNPYLNLTYDAFSLRMEFAQAQFQNGRSTVPLTSTAIVTHGVTSMASPYGFNLIPSYKINDQWELVGRYSFLSTNGRGTNMADVVWNGPNSPGSTTLYDNVWAAYAGVNYYIIGTAVKLSVGYEYADFTGRQIAQGAQHFTGSGTGESIIRARLQVAF
jgi:hypothetical protein